MLMEIWRAQGLNKGRKQISIENYVRQNQSIFKGAEK
jgi:hypothetical protein